MKERLTQEENNIKDLDTFVDCLSKSRNKAKSMKMVTACFVVFHSANGTFLSVFTLPAEKRALQQTPLHIFFVGNPSPICNSQPPPHGLEAHMDPSPQEEMHMSSDKAPDSSVSPKNPSNCQSNV
jgi:hypothetical protein